MHKKNMFKAIVAIAVAIALLVPGSAAFANVGTIGVTSNSENTVNIKPMVESTNSDNSYNTDITTILPTLGTIEVDDDNPDPNWYDATHVRTITEGVNNATAGDTVYVYSGTYYECVQVTKQLDFVGESRENVVIYATPSGYNPIKIEAPVKDVSIDNFTITNGGNGIYVGGSSGINITNCDIYDNSGHGISAKAIYQHALSDINIANCDIHDNSNYGIWISGFGDTPASYFNVTNCNLYRNGYGFRSDNGASNINIIGCNAYNNGVDAISIQNNHVLGSIIDCNMYDNYRGITIYASANIIVTNCNVYNSTREGIKVFPSPYYPSEYNTITGCNVYNNTREGIIIESTTDSEISYCNVYGNPFDGISIGGDRNTITNCDVYNNDGAGIYLSGRFSEYNIIANCNVYNNNVFTPDILSVSAGIYLNGLNEYAWSNNEVTNCNVHDNEGFGIFLSSSTGCTLIDNTIINDDLFVFGTDLANYVHDIGTSNTVNGEPIFYLIMQNGVELNETHNFGFLALIGCTNMIVKNSEVYGMIMIGTTGSTISNVECHGSLAGIFLGMSSNNNFINCNIYNNIYGIVLMMSPNNLIYNNYFDNMINAFDDVSAGTNTWNIAKTAGTNIIGGPFLGGNFWSNYAGEDLDSDGLGDTLLPYNNGYYIQGGGDFLPLVQVPVVPAVVSISPSTQTVNKGEAFTFSVYVEPGDTPIKGMAFGTLSFDQTLIQVDSIVEGDIAELNPFDPGTIDNVNGEITNAYGFVKTGTVTTPGSFIVVSCHALQKLGTSDLVLIEVDVSDVDNQPIPTTVNNGDVVIEQIYHTLDITIVGSGTVNCDPIGDPPGTYEENTVVTLTPDPAVGWVFAGWSGPDAGDLVPVHDHTMFKNSADSSVILVRSLISNINTFYEVPPGEDITFFPDGSYIGSSEFDSFQADIKESATVVTYTVTAVSNCSSGPSKNGPWTPIKVDDKLTTCTWYKRDVMTCSSLKVQDQNGNNLSMPHTDIIYIIGVHHVPNDPRFENVNGYKDYADCNYAAFDTTSDHCIASGNTLVKPGAQIGLSSQIAEAFIPQRSGETVEGVFEVCNIGDPSPPDRWAITMDSNKEVTATFIFGDEEPPVITGITLTTSDPLDTDPLYGWEKVTCTVTDNVEVRDVKLVVTYLETTPVDYPMIKDGDTYSYEITLTDVGDYTYHIWADDTSDNNATSTPEAFVLPPNWDIVVDLENRECYFYDLGAVVAAYGDTGSPGWIREDWNNNGEVYFYDLGEIVKRYGQTW